ncbi:SurA N-terminal domain-containing protein [Oceanobacillus halotolerans]|uniref:SurA N-terminal domain-containing protein n=1 Tax=Oceanobacillus halotolerans TaxID=2663380 RepID=UPI0013DB6791|nr:SurA N-terminal domain-containing protein [Oceanobacillus halotolerans]
MNKKFVRISLAALVLLLAACGGDSNEDNNEEAEPGENAQEMEMPEPDLEGIPDVVAEVNGQAIPKEDFEASYMGQFQQFALQAQMTGEEINQDQLKEQVAENLIGTELLIQEAESRDYEVSDEAVDETFEGIVAQNGLESKEEFLAAMEEQGTEEEEVMSQVALQVKVNQLVSEEAGETEPTEEELEQAYEEMKAQQEAMAEQTGEEAEVPSFDEVKSDLEEQVVTQKESESTQLLVENLREEADVTNHLSL